MWSGRAVPSVRLIKLLALLLVLLAVGIVVPTAALAASGDSKPLPEGPSVTASDEGRRPTSIRRAGEDQTVPGAPSVAGGLSMGADAGISTLTPMLFSDTVENGASSWSAQSPWAITTEWDLWGDGGNHSWSDSPGGNYAGSVDSSLTSDMFDLSTLAPSQLVELTFLFTGESEYLYDVLYVEFSSNGGASWNYYGDYIDGDYSDDTYFFWAEVPKAMCTSQFKFRLRMSTDSSFNYDGFHVDYVNLYAYSTDYVGPNDSRLAYFGSWSTNTVYDGGFDAWSYKRTTTPGDLVRLDFNGPAFSLIGKVGPDYGIATVSVDGGPPEEADFYINPSWYPEYWLYPNWVYQVDNLSDGPHTVTIFCSGTKNPASTGYAISVAYLEVWGTVSTASGVSHYEEDETDLEYAGPWARTYDGAASGSYLTSVNAMGSSVNIDFDGVYLAWNAKKGPGYGKAKVSLDGGPLQTVDLYNAWDSSKRRVYNTGLLTGGSHTLSIYWSGEKNSAAWGTKVDVDSFDVYDNTVDASKADPMTWRYQQSESRLSYLGDWSGANTWSASGGSFAYTSQPGAAVVAEFEGTEITALFRTTPWYGKARVTLDPGTGFEVVDIVDLYSPGVAWKVGTLYSKTGLADTTHTLVIECVGDSNPGSSGTSIALDALDILGYLDQAPQTTRIDDNNATYATYAPAWSRWDASGYWAAYQDTYAFTDQDDYEVTVTFHGTHLAWVSRKANTQGKAEVRLYEGAVNPGNLISTQTIDLYSPSTIWKKRVYSTGMLDDGTYNVVIKCLREKNPASWWYSIGVDAFDVVVTPE